MARGQLLRTAAVVLLITLFCRQQSSTQSFVLPSYTVARRCTGSTESSSSTALGGRVQKSRRRTKVDRSRAKQFYDAIDEARGEKKKKKKSTVVPPPNGEGNEDGGQVEDAEDKPMDATASARELEEARGGVAANLADSDREARAEAARKRMEQRPEVSTIIVDEDSGIEVVMQGKTVMDVVTRKSVKLSDLGPEYRLAQMFPGVPMPVRQQYRFDWKTVEVPEMLQALREACSVALPDGSRGIPQHPSVANKAIDFVLANRDLLGFDMKKTLGRLQLRSMSQGNKEQAIEDQKLWKNFCTLENHISAPFRQMLMDAEGRIGPNFGNLDVKTYCDGELYERCANYLVLKGMVANWEKKVRDAEYIENTPQTKENYITVMAHGDPKRYLPNPPILFTLRECTQVCYMSQQLTKAFVEEPGLFNDLPPELRFLEIALTIKGGTALRKYVAEDFCPSEGITPEALREGMRRLLQQLDNMQVDPYGDLTNIVERLCIAMAVGTDEQRWPYAPYLAPNTKDGPGSFQTYTFNHDKLSIVRFLDSQYERAENQEAPNVAASLSGGAGLGGLFNLEQMQQQQQTRQQTTREPADDKPEQKPKWTFGVDDDEEEVYKVPEARAAGRPHELGWLNMLDEYNDDPNMKMGTMKPGKIIME